MQIWILDPSATAERRLWIEGWARYSRHSIRAFVLPPSWGTRHEFAPLLARERARRLARQIRRHLTGSAARDPTREPAGLPDLVLLTDGLDGPTFIEGIGDLLAGIPLWIYWHFSAMATPETSAPETIAIELCTVRLVARCVFHGEAQHRQFLHTLSRHEPELARQIESHAAVLPPGFEPFPASSEASSFREPLALWILRGDPEEIPLLIAALEHPALRSRNFQVLLLSERPDLEGARAQRLPPSLRARILGILSPVDPQTPRWARAARAVVEGNPRLHSPIHLARLAFAGPWPLAPAGSGLLEAIPETLRPRCAYNGPQDLAERLAAILKHPPPDAAEIRCSLTAWTWPLLAPRYDALCETIGDSERLRLF